MEKIAKDITVFVGTHFGKQRPFEIIEGKMVKTPQFPNTMGKNEQAVKSNRIEGVLLDSDYLPENTRGLFMEGNTFRAGIYYGDIYRIPLKDKYYLFRVEREPSKTLRLPHITTEITHLMSIFVESPGGRISRICVQRGDGIENDIQLLTAKISGLKGCFREIKDLATENIEQYVRTYYLMNKINKIGGKK